MALAGGSSLGPYEIQDAIGAGGMGEVYKARDTRLNRSVAIKVLPEHVAANPERKQRFVREAQAVAALNHPNICVVHDVGEDGGTQYMVMEYLEGEPLDARLSKGPLPLDQALKCAVEIADALDKAHQSGVLHRDVKPANIMLTKSGAKLLDFGLAKLGAMQAGVHLDSVQTAGRTEPNLTGQGMILGTLQYMAPEQIEGEEADARSDIFAFGAVVYEMITGRKAFKGKSQASLIASILEHDPLPMPTLQQMTPAALDQIVRVCLSKDPNERWQNAHDLLVQLKWVSDGSSQVSVSSATISRRKYREMAAWGLAGLGLAGALALAAARFLFHPPEASPVQFSIAPPENAFFTVGTLLSAPFPVVSPDGKHVAFVATRTGATARRLWVRSLSSNEPRELPGTDGVLWPFWSSDSREIGFFAEGKLKRIEQSGGPILIVSNVADGPSGGTWNADGTIIFAPRRGALARISAAGGEATPVTALDASRKEGAHHWPFFLPDGKHFLFVAEPPATVFVGSLDSKETKRLLTADSMTLYAPPGYLLFLRQATLMGQSFDAARQELRGEPFRIAENIRFTANGTGVGSAAFSVSNNGVLLYRTGNNAGSMKAVWFDETGKELDPINQSGDSRNPRLSPDDSRIAVQRTDADGRSDIWVIDVARGTNTRLTFSPSDETYPMWTPDGTQIVYSSNQNGKFDLFRKAAGAGNEELLFKSDQDKLPVDWSPDGKFLLFRTTDPKTSTDLWILPATGDKKPFPFVQTPFTDGWGSFSPDGKWIAYSSDESGTMQVYVQPFPATGEKWQASVDNGSTPLWRRDGKQLFFLTADNRVMAVDVDLKTKFQAGLPKRLFQVPGLAGIGSALRASITHDGKRFLLVTSGASAESPLTVQLNWTSQLKN